MPVEDVEVMWTALKLKKADKPGEIVVYLDAPPARYDVGNGRRSRGH